MLFAGQYLNLFGVILLLTGLASYLKSTDIATGVIQTLLGGALGLVFLVAGEVLHRRGQQFSQPLVMGGYVLLFFVVCSAHFRYGLIGQASLFLCLLPLVIGSVISVFRYDSKLIGNAMLVVFFFTPVFITFSFHSFWAIFCYLLAINLGSAVVAFYKKWDFQLLMAALGSYTLYFAHFREEATDKSLLVLFVIYGLSLLANNLLYFFRRVNSEYNLVLSFINPTVFAALSAVTILGLPNWARVTAYSVLAALHLILAVVADDRRAESENFLPLATSNLSLALLFSWAAISFVTYFSDNTEYFGAVTLLMFALALGLQVTGFRLARHSVVLSRFSYFGILMAVTQVVYVLPSMQGSSWLQVASLGLYGAYFGLFLWRRVKLSSEQNRVLLVTGVAGVFFFADTICGLISAPLSMLLLGGLALLSMTLPMSQDQLPKLVSIPFLLSGAVGLISIGSWRADTPGGLVLPAFVVALAIATHSAFRSGRKVDGMWFWVMALTLRMVLSPMANWETLVVALAACHLGSVSLGIRAAGGKELIELTPIISALIVLFGIQAETAQLPALTLCLLILGVSHLVAFRANQRLHLVDMALHIVLLARVGYSAYEPYPLTCLVLCGALAAGLARFKLHRISVAVYGLVGLGAVTIEGLAQGSTLAWLGLILVPATFVPGYFWCKSDEPEQPCEVLIAGFGFLALVRLSLAAEAGPLSTLLWAVMATVLLRGYSRHYLITNWNDFGQGLFDISRLLYFISFVKSIVYDANFVERPDLLHYPAAFLLGGVFLMSAHLWIQKREARNVFVVLGLLNFCFQLTFLAHGWWGDRIAFQPVLSGFWSLTGFLIIWVGVVSSVKIYRMFGLTTLVGNTVKILLVDIHVLDSYSKTNTYLILGTLLMMTSFLYQRQKHRLCGNPVTTLDPEPVPL
jgi:hypothetical protein